MGRALDRAVDRAGDPALDLVAGLRQVIEAGAPAQARQAQEFLQALGAGDRTIEDPARDLVRAFLHDPDLWR